MRAIALFACAVASLASAADYPFTLDTRTLPDGQHTVDAVAYDAAGNSTVSAPVTIIVDNTPPTVAITAPADGAHVAGKVQIRASAADASPCTQRLSIDGAVVATAACGSIGYTWQVRRVPKGLHVISVTAIDALGNTATRQISVVVGG